VTARVGARGGVVPVPQRLVIVVPTSAAYDSRTARIAGSLAARGHAVTVLARPGDGRPAAEEPAAGYRVVRVGREATRRLPVPLRILDRAAATRAQRRGALRADPGADLYHAMGYMGIPVALALACAAGGRVVYDARDLYADGRTLAHLPRPFRAMVRARENRWARRAGRVVTVNEALARVLATRLGIATPAVVMNCPPRWDPPAPPERRFHARLGLAPGTRVVLYHGGFVRDRGIEALLAAVSWLPPDAVVVLLGYGPLRDTLAEAARAPGLAGRVHLLDAVPPDELLGWVASADIAVMANQPATLNERLSTPNKLFESLAAGTPVVSSDFPERRRIVIDDPDGPLGAVCDPTDPAALGAAIAGLLRLDEAAAADLRARCLRAAHARYAWETQLEVLLGVYADLTGRPW
jgi:glycogen(starch) synthase